MDVCKLWKRIVQEARKSENKRKRNVLLFESGITVLYIGIMLLQYRGAMTISSGNVGRWCVILASVLGYLQYLYQGKK